MDNDLLIALDWGTSSLRAYLLGADGRVLDQREAAAGIMHVAAGAYRDTFESVCGDWLARHPEVAAIASGMIGSRQGWREAAYAQTPAGFAELSSRLLRIDADAGRAFAIVPGVSCVLPCGTHDVMRGEETQVFGALDPAEPDATIVLPGTHSKWVDVRAARITAFRTYMTGELFAVLAGHSILGRLFPADASAGEDTGRAFDEGLTRALDDPAGLSSLLFSVRAEGLFATYDAAELPAYLSGLLIGAEIGHARSAHALHTGPVIVVGSRALQTRYLRALAQAGITARAGASDAATVGLARIAREAGLR